MATPDRINRSHRYPLAARRSKPPGRGFPWVVTRGDGLQAVILMSSVFCKDAPPALSWCVGIRKIVLASLFRQMGCRFAPAPWGRRSTTLLGLGGR